MNSYSIAQKIDEIMDDFISGVVKTFSPVQQYKDFKALRPREWFITFAMVAATLVAFILGKDFSVNGWVSVVTGVATALSLILVDRGFVSNYAWGFLGSICWFVVALHNRLIGDLASQLFYVVMQFVGIYVWERDLKTKNDPNEVQAVTSKKMTPWQVSMYILGTVIIYLIVLSVSHHLNGTQIFLDATLLPLGIAGQFLMTWGFRSQWVAWILIDAINVIIWVNQLIAGGTGAASMLTLQVVMLLQAFYGTYLWFNRSKEE